LTSRPRPARKTGGTAMTPHPILGMAIVLAAALSSGAGEANTWTKLERATIAGRRWDVPLGYAADLGRFMVLGGRASWADYKKPRSYDVLTLDLKEGWENTFPKGKDWGPRFGACQAPAWKDEYWHLRDVEGNVRPNWTVYGTFSLGQ